LNINSALRGRRIHGHPAGHSSSEASAALAYALAEVFPSAGARAIVYCRRSGLCCDAVEIVIDGEPHVVRGPWREPTVQDWTARRLRCDPCAPA
jgi:hypothetical protein